MNIIARRSDLVRALLCAQFLFTRWSMVLGTLLLTLGSHGWRDLTSLWKADDPSSAPQALLSHARLDSTMGERTWQSG